MHGLRWPSPRYLAGVVLLAAAYYGAAKVGQMLRYTGSVSAIWPPAGVGIAALYLWGVRWWPGVLLGELLVNGQLLARRQHIPGGKPGRPAGREHGRDHRRGAPAAPPARPERRDGPGRAGRPHARGARHRDRDQRDGRHDLDGRGRCGRALGRGRVLAHLVARRHLGRTCRPAAGARVGSGSRGRWRRIATWEGAAMVVAVAALSAARVLDRRSRSSTWCFRL